MTDRRRRRGQSLVEFALVIPIFLLILFGLVDGGRLVYTYNTVSNAARDAARVAIVNQSTTGTNTCDTTSASAYAVGCGVQSGLALSLAQSDVTVDYLDPTDPTLKTVCATITIGCLAQVTVTATFEPLTPIAGTIIGNVTVSSVTTMPVERVCSNPTAPPIPHC